MILLKNKQNVIAPSGTFPFGATQDQTESVKGTPANTETFGDLMQLLEKLFADSGLTANGEPDNATNGFQLFQALWACGNKNLTADVITGLLGGYTTNDLIVLWGANISGAINPGTATNTAGAIFYNGQIYKVPANASIVTTTGQILLWVMQADPAGGLPVINLIAGTSLGIGVPGYLADYNGASVLQFAVLLQSNYTQTDNTKADYIQNKPVISITRAIASIAPSSGTGNFNIDSTIEIVGDVKRLIISISTLTAWVSAGSNITLDLTSILGGNTINTAGVQAGAISASSAEDGVQIGGYITVASSTSIQVNFSLGTTSGHHITVYGQIVLRLN